MSFDPVSFLMGQKSGGGGSSPAQGPFDASSTDMSVTYYYKQVGGLVFVNGSATPEADLGNSGLCDIDFTDLPSGVTFGFVSSNSNTISSTDRRPISTIAAIGGKTIRFVGPATKDRVFGFAFIYI